MAYCRLKEEIQYFYLTKESAQDCLEAMGFGKEICKLTEKLDGRYGRVTENGIEFGFKNRMNAKWRFGKYVVEDLNESSWQLLNKEDFFDLYEPIKA